MDSGPMNPGSSMEKPRVVVTELETEVAVLEGSAEVTHRYDREAFLELPAGVSAIADFSTLRDAEKPGTDEHRALMFREYVEWVRRQARG